ncbi:MAG: FAD-binding oxidoreductase [Thermodesulfobacteriota bacterium]
MADSNASPKSKRHVIVIGAGIVGTCCALYLQREGFQVTLIEKNKPGVGASGANAGNLGIASCVPLSTPGMVWQVPGMMLDKTSALKLRWRYFPGAIPFLIRFMRAGNRKKVEEIADALLSLMSRLHDAYQPLLDDANAHDLIKQLGRATVYQTEKGLAGCKYSVELRQRRDIEIEMLSGDELREIIPDLSPEVKGGYHILKAIQCFNPERLVEVFAEHLVRQGGSLLYERVHGVEDATDGKGCSVLTDLGRHSADAVVLSAGAWSTPLVKQLGARVPMHTENGYYTMFPNPGVRLPIPITGGDCHVALAEMEGGLRVSGIAEYVPVDVPPKWEYCEAITEHTKTLLPGLNVEGAYNGLGPRPSMPDGKPVIGRSPRYPWAFFAFGHGHVGLGTGAITGRIISQLVAGRPPEVDLAPFRHDRF